MAPTARVKLMKSVLQLNLHRAWTKGRPPHCGSIDLYWKSEGPCVIVQIPTSPARFMRSLVCDLEYVHFLFSQSLQPDESLTETKEQVRGKKPWWDVQWLSSLRDHVSPSRLFLPIYLVLSFLPSSSQLHSTGELIHKIIPSPKHGDGNSVILIKRLQLKYMFVD